MAIVIDAQQLVRNKTGLPTEAFFVDTNVLLDINDPFGLSLSDVMLAQRNEILSDIVHRLKSADGVRSFSTLSVALEYYKHIQVGFYQTQVNKAPGAREALKFSTTEFKRLRDSDAQFMLGWELQLKLFKKTFSKNYQIYDASPQVSDVLSTFQGSKVDFGDHLLFKTVM
jgi:hypothetical protein